MTEISEEYKFYTLYPISELKKFYQFVVNNKINAEGFLQYRNLWILHDNDSFCINNWNSDLIKDENGKYVIHRMSKRVEFSISYTIFHRFLKLNDIKYTQIAPLRHSIDDWWHPNYQLLPIEIRAATELTPAFIGLPLFDSLLCKLAGFPIEYQNGRNDLFFFRSSPYPISYFFRFKRKSLIPAVSHEVEKKLSIVENQLSKIAFDQFKLHNPQPLGYDFLYRDFEIEKFRGELLNAYRLDKNDGAEGLLWHSPELIRTRRFSRSCQYTFRFTSESYALLIGTRPYYFEEDEQFCSDVARMIIDSINAEERNKNAPSDPPNRLDAFEGDSRNEWNVD